MDSSLESKLPNRRTFPYQYTLSLSIFEDTGAPETDPRHMVAEKILERSGVYVVEKVDG